MNKYFKLLFVALFATMTLSLASCKDDKDEPDSMGSTSFSDMTLKVNGETFYYGLLQMDAGFLKTYKIGVVNVSHDGTVSCGITAVDKKMDFADWLEGLMYGNPNVRYIAFDINLTPFDFKSAQKGQKLTIKNGDGVYYKGDPMYEWEYKSISGGDVTFVSYQEETDDVDELLIIELNNVTLSSAEPIRPSQIYYEAPKTLSFTGTIMLTDGEIYGVYN